MRDEPPSWVLAVFRDLQRRLFGVGYDDLLALRSALRAGFGLHSDQALVELCVALWASSPSEAAVVRALFARHGLPGWELDDLAVAPEESETEDPVLAAGETVPATEPAAAVPAAATVVAEAPSGLAPLPPLAEPGDALILVPQYPLPRRVVAQAFRRLRRPVRSGPLVELDMEATIARISVTGVAGAPVMVPRRRNLARLLLLIDRQGSMAPFHPYLDHLRDAVVEDGALERVQVGYFHDNPVDRVDPRLLRRLSGLAPDLDPVLSRVEPSLEGVVFRDAEMFDAVPLAELVDSVGDDVGVVVLSDIGAVRGVLDSARSLAAIAFARALYARRHRVVWLNPMPVHYWPRTTAEQLARHVPVLPLDRAGLHRAVDVLRGRPVTLARAA